MFDLLIRKGRVVDGTGLPWFRADVGITDDRIAAVGPLGHAPAKQTIDAAGKVVCPGFVDAHVHGDSAAPQRDEHPAPYPVAHADARPGAGRAHL